MKLIDFLPISVIEPFMHARDKNSAIEELVGVLVKNYEGLDSDLILKVLLDREKLGSTGTGSGVAIPHGKIKGLKKVLLAFGRVPGEGIDFDSIDGKPAHFLFLIAAPEVSVGIHLSLLAKINKISADSSVQSKIMNAESAAEIRRILDEADIEG